MLWADAVGRAPVVGLDSRLTFVFMLWKGHILNSIGFLWGSISSYVRNIALYHYEGILPVSGD